MIEAALLEFADHGFTLTATARPDFAVLGFDTTLTYEKIWRLCDLIVAGVPYIATHPDVNCPTETGFMPDIGAMMALIAASTGKQPDVIIGKPYAPIVEALADKLGLEVGSVAVASIKSTNVVVGVPS